MYVPIIPNTTIINKTIVYSDTVLNLKDIGSNIKVNSISNVSEYSLDSCLKTIFESNPNVVFNTIQYSKNNKKVYFYTNKEISTKTWEAKKIKAYKHLSSNIEILEEIKTIFNLEANKDTDSISLYDIYSVAKREYDRLAELRNNYKDTAKRILREKLSEKASIVIYDFDYEKNALKIGFARYWRNDFNKICFSKKNGDLYILESEEYYSDEVLASIGNVLSQLYDEFLEFKDYETKSSHEVKPINANFLVNISKYGVDIYIRSKLNMYYKDFSLSHNTSDSEKYKCKCNSNTLLSTITGNEDELFKRIFVKIEDCPEWMRESLFELRKKQVQDQINEEREEQYRQMKKQKRLELRNKIFPFLKK